MSKICTLDIINGYVINQIRLEAGYKKQGELGEKFRMSHAAIGKIERGESSVSFEFLTILAEMIGTRASKIMAVTEEITDYLTAHDVAILSQVSYNIIHSLVKEAEGNSNEHGAELILPTNFEDHITLELKKSVRNLVAKKPDLDIKEVQEQVESAATSITILDEIITPSNIAVGFAAAVSLVNPLIGIGVGASLLATKFIKNKKAP